jgi:hypothetical protein
MLTRPTRRRARPLNLNPITTTHRRRKPAPNKERIMPRFEPTTKYLLLAMIVLGNLQHAARAAEKELPLTFSGGHTIAHGDFGRPVYLIAAGLGVTPDQFRDAFSGVTPARGRAPTRDEERRNKAALMKVLKPLGVTNERLDEVANHYRFRPQEGELWPITPAKGYAVVEDGKVKRLVITDPGSGYNTPPDVTLTGMEGVRLKATLSFGKDLAKNGGVAAVARADETAR